MKLSSVHIDRTFDEIENVLSHISAFPVAGILAGVAKICMGTVQAITALACGILMLVPSICKNDYSSIHYSWTHIKHGIANIVAGVFEGTPILGTIIYVLRFLKGTTNSDYQVYVHVNCQEKFMPYESLLRVSVGGADEDLAKPAAERYGKALAEEQQRTTPGRLLSFEKQLELAHAAIGRGGSEI
jgi:hypothetical protein